MCTPCFETQSSPGCTCTLRSKILTYSLQVNGYQCVCDDYYVGQNCDTHCPRDYSKKYDSLYRIIDGKCFYFRNTKYDYEPHEKFCKELFSGNGRLYEPTDLGTFDKIQKMAFKQPGVWYKNGKLKLRNYPDKIRDDKQVKSEKI